MLTVPGAPSFAGAVNFSVELWHRPEVVDASRRFLIGRVTALGGWYMYSQDAELAFVLYGSPALSVFGTPLGVVAYTHVVVTYDDAASTLSLYENGVLAHAMTGSTVLPSPTAEMTVAAPAGITLAKSSGPFDEIALYDYVLNGTQIKAHYDAR
jgi:hypothetical protein